MRQLTFGITAILLNFSQAFAAEGAHGAAHGIPSDVKWQAANIIVFIGILVYFGGAKVKAFFAGRNEEYHRVARETEKARKDLEAKAADLARRTLVLGQTSDQSLAKAHVEADMAMKDMVTKAKEDAARIIADAESQLKSGYSKQMEKLRVEALEMSLVAAESKLENLGTSEKSKVNAGIAARVEGATV
jgi:F0F1-type ATP synthase membrane subunit b/b'